MSLRKEYLEYIFEMLEKAGYKNVDGLWMCELGNQRIKKSTFEYFKDKGMPQFKTGKEYFTHIGFNHTSIDINGKDGALPIDLATPISDKNLIGCFDVITNSGTSEHVLNQFECFKNIHNLCKKGGLVIHIVPGPNYRNIVIETGEIIPHGHYNYPFEFFYYLANICKYTVLDERMVRNLVAVAMIKTRDNDFVSKEQFNQLHIEAV